MTCLQRRAAAAVMPKSGSAAEPIASAELKAGLKLVWLPNWTAATHSLQALSRPCPSNDGDNGDVPALGLKTNVNSHCKSGLERWKPKMKVCVGIVIVDAGHADLIFAV